MIDKKAYILLVKFGAAGDILRTTPILYRLREEYDLKVIWLVDDNNYDLLSDNPFLFKAIKKSDKESLLKYKFFKVFNLEESKESCDIINAYVNRINGISGVYFNTSTSRIEYTSDLKELFNMSSISILSAEEANELKYFNKFSYQELIFKLFTRKFNGEKYILPENYKKCPILLEGDIAIASSSNGVWPNKNWLFYNELKSVLENDYKLKVNFLPYRKDNVLQHVKDIESHSLLISGDSLPMHITLGLGMKCITIFTCTSPTEIYDYGVQEKIISPRLKEFFYKKEYDINAVNCIKLKDVLNYF